jgi:hypothetical protein
MALYLFQRVRAANVLIRAMKAWRMRKEARKLQSQGALQAFMGTLTLQRAWKRYRYRKMLHRRYRAAQVIQARVRGSLTRNFWAKDPGVISRVCFINPTSGYVYMRYTLVHGDFSPSYSVRFIMIIMITIFIYGPCVDVARHFFVRGFFGSPHRVRLSSLGHVSCVSYLSIYLNIYISFIEDALLNNVNIRMHVCSAKALDFL